MTAVSRGRVATVVFGIACTAVEPPMPPQSLTPVTPTSGIYGVVGEQLDRAPVVRLVAPSGLPIAGSTVAFRLLGGGSLGSNTATTAIDGTATPGSWTLGTKVGYQPLVASVEGAADTFFVFARTGPPAALTCVGGCNQSGPASSTLLGAVQVRLADRFDNPVANAVVDFDVTAGGGSMTPGSSSTDGVAATWWSLGREGVNAATATSGNLAITLSATARATTPVVGTSYQLESIQGVGPAPASRLVLGSDGRFAETLTDGHGDLLGNGTYVTSGENVTLSYTDGFLAALRTATGYSTASFTMSETGSFAGDSIAIARCEASDWNCSGARWTFRRVQP